MTKYNYDEIPTTEQGVITFKTYAENHIKVLRASIKKLENFIIECNRRLEEWGKNNG